MRYEGVDTIEFDMFIASRSCGQVIDADPETTNLVQEFGEGLSKKPETEQTEKFKEDLYINAFGEDPHGCVRCMDRGITCNKFRNLSSSNTPTTEIKEQIDELQQLKDVLKCDIKNVELLKFEFVNQKEDFFQEKERMIAEVRREFGEDLDHMKVSLDYFVSLVDSSTLQAALSCVSTRGEKVGAGWAKESNECDYRPVQVGSDVVLFYSEIPKESVVEGMLLSIDLNEKIDEVALGYEHVKVVIRKTIKPNYFLERSPRGVTTIRQAIEKSVAWEYVNVSIIS
ncbi:hypothetical protein BUALT_Bualt11G0043800 [Buddleja alternifolia]|uniref:Uncharacterized protein n=1 Tax=Buddleja alternifolia TaxID=168488 RepID=A0AAV6WSS4_9LAMI|nr:hypothetical protein BUALT_Bualt11G0043800 [Buddleja alternifolia]